MQNPKYYDHKNNRPLNLELDGCSLAEWDQLYGNALFARHPKGFKIFLPPNKIADNDEYADSDPYTVEQNINSEFHRRRIELTIDLIREAISLVQGTPQILDLGCGQGHVTDKMRQTLLSAEFTGLDYSISAIDYAHEHYPEIDFSVGDAYASPYSKDFFDLVVCNNLWEHVPDPIFLLSKIKEICKPGGYIIISTPSRYRVVNLVRILRGKPVIFMSKHHVTEYTVGQVIEQIEYGGFQVRKILSRSIRTESLTIEVVRRLLAIIISMIGSHHQLESTVFYLAKKETSISEQKVAVDGCP
jgi:2-polyprenyl-3-methyl-5-hydroxy-6-metoxy-1,4-benzoquinol methylase